jgi:segregation and condensation protein B
MNEFYIRNVIEAALLAAGKSLQLAEIGQLFDENSRPKVDDVRAAIDALAAEYSSRGVEVKETAAGFRIQVRREFSSEISRLWPERPARYSRALLETLALIAYRQPITRAEIEAVRGVAVNPNIIKTVIERNWVRVVGHRDVPGRPELLGTTREFLDYFGLRSLDELPPLGEIKAMGDYNLQLDLPSAALPDGEVRPEGLEGEGTVAGLLTSDAANADDASGADGLGEGGEGVSDVVAAGARNADANSANGGDAVHAPAAEAAGAGDVAQEADDHAEGNAGSDLVDGTDSDAAHVDAAHDATETVAGGVRSESEAGSAVASNAQHDSDTDAEAERTLTSGKATRRNASTADDPDPSSSAITDESPDASDDSADDDADDDELSADGHGSRELVAAPRDFDD